MKTIIAKMFMTIALLIPSIDAYASVNENCAIQFPSIPSEISLAPLTICKALDQAIAFINISPEQIIPVNSKQDAFLQRDYAVYRRHMTDTLFRPDELQAYVAEDAETLNKILRDHGFSIQLKPFRPSEVGIVAIQDIIVTWNKKAEHSTIQAAGKTYPSFIMDEKNNDITFFVYHDQENHIIIAEILTQSHDKVYCAVKMKTIDGQNTVVPFFDYHTENIDDLTVAHTIAQWQQNVKNNPLYSYTFNALELPMIMYHAQPSLEWLLKLQLSSGYVVTQALQEVIFKMNEIGAQAKAAVAIAIRELSSAHSAPQNPLIVNQPFLLWIERPGMPLPLFAAYLTQEHWAAPPSFEK